MDHSDLAAAAAQVFARSQKPVPPGIQPFIEAVEESIATQNWYAALVGALVLPDICGKLESPDLGSMKRYVAWAERYITPAYTMHGSADDGDTPDALPRHVFLAGGDCYALRCAVLHEGVDAIAEQRAAVAVSHFRFVVSATGDSSWHCKQSDSLLFVQVDRFCRDVVAGAQAWLDDVADKPEIQRRMRSLMKIFLVQVG